MRYFTQWFAIPRFVVAASLCRGAGYVATLHGDTAPWLQDVSYFFLLRPDFSAPAA